MASDWQQFEAFFMCAGQGALFFHEKAIAEYRAHRQAKEQILLDLVKLGPGDFLLVGKHVLAGKHDQKCCSERATLS